MSHIYDIQSDQLKCNFCTQWFKCTLHFANMQRYALKACPHCFNHFSYTLLHPDNYRIYKVILLDTNANIPHPKKHSLLCQTLAQPIDQVKEDIMDRIGNYYEQKIRELMVQMNKSSKRVEEMVNTIQNNLPTTFQEKQLQKVKEDIIDKMSSIKSRPLDYWFIDRERRNKNASSYATPTIRVLQEKENNIPTQTNKGWGKAIKNKIGISAKDQTNKMKTSFVDVLNKPRSDSNSLSKSTLMKGLTTRSAKKLNMSVMSLGSREIEERDLGQITRLLEIARKNDSYLPYQVLPDNTSLIKNQSKRTHADSIFDLRSTTVKGGELIELIGKDISRINFECFLKSLGTNQKAKTIRVIKAKMTDFEFDSLLRFISKHPNIQTMIVTNNKLTELSVMALLSFVKVNKESSLKRVYLGGNYLNRQKVGQICRCVCDLGVELYF